MTVAEILAAIELGSKLIQFGTMQIEALKAGGYSAEQVAQIKQDAGLSDEAYDAALAAAKARLAGGNA